MEHGRRISRFRELELESLGLDDEHLQRIGGLLRSAGAVDAEPIPKVVRALGPAATAPADAVPPEIGPEQPAGAAVRAALTEAVERIVQHDAGMRMEDVESLHQARVGMRRLRSHLRVFAPLLDDRSGRDALHAELHGLGAPARRACATSTSSSIACGEVAADLRPVVDPLLDDLARRRDRGSARAARAAARRTLRRAPRAARGRGRRAEAPAAPPPGRPGPRCRRSSTPPGSGSRSTGDRDDGRLDRCRLPRAPHPRQARPVRGRRHRSRPRRVPTGRRGRDPEAPDRAPDAARRAPGRRDGARGDPCRIRATIPTTGRSTWPPGSRSSGRRSARTWRDRRFPTRGASCAVRSIGDG